MKKEVVLTTLNNDGVNALEAVAAVVGLTDGHCSGRELTAAVSSVPSSRIL